MKKKLEKIEAIQWNKLSGKDRQNMKQWHGRYIKVIITNSKRNDIHIGKFLFGNLNGCCSVSSEKGLTINTSALMDTTYCDVFVVTETRLKE